jgi:adenosylmethionine-8-amino-7-oxononanoate aminotransferase/mannose-6-phosphate isomerase-like protein (cupin superfamily)
MAKELTPEEVAEMRLEDRAEYDDQVRSRIMRFDQTPPNWDLSPNCRLAGHERANYVYIGRGVYLDRDEPMDGRRPAVVPGQNYSMVILLCAPGKGAPLHAHTTEETFMALSGRWAVFWGESAQHQETLEQWDAVSFPGPVMRGFRNVGTSDAYLLSVIGGGNPPPPINHPDVVRALAEHGLAQSWEAQAAHKDHTHDELPTGVPQPRPTSVPPHGEGMSDPVAADLAHVIHPVSPVRHMDGTDLRIVESGRGLRLRDVSGREVLDAVSGLWNVAVGYGRPELAEAAAEALARIGFASLYFSRGSTETALLAARLAELTPVGIDRFFFTSEGSTAVDTAIKLVRYEHAQRGEPQRQKLIARWESYHGASIGSVGATGQPEFWQDFGIQLSDIHHISQPRGRADDAVAELEQTILEEGPETVAAFIAEPVSIPSGVVVPEPDYWPRIREICSRYGVRLILDEVVTGFGRTGKMFAAEHWALAPDVIVLSKGLTSGYFPLAAVGVSEEVFAGIARTDRVLMHGFTTGGHPAGCAVALRNLRLIDEEALVQRAANSGRLLHEALEALAKRTGIVAAVRSLGLLAALDIAVPGGGEADSKRVGELVVAGMARRGVLVRSYGASIVLAPSLVVQNGEIDEIIETLE